MSDKYTSLASHLKKSDQERIRMTFGEVENFVQGKLPPSAWEHRAWWSNSTSHSHARHGWLSVGYETSRVDLDEQELIFMRVGRPGGHLFSREIAATSLQQASVQPARRGRAKLEDIVRDAGGVDNLNQVTLSIKQYIDGDLLESDLGRILRKLWPR